MTSLTVRHLNALCDWCADVAVTRFASSSGHPCDNCYTKALVLPHQTALVLTEYVEQRFMARISCYGGHALSTVRASVLTRSFSAVQEKPVDWLLADVERASGTRLRALVPALAEHVGCAALLPARRHAVGLTQSRAGIRAACLACGANGSAVRTSSTCRSKGRGSRCGAIRRRRGP